MSDEGRLHGGRRGGRPKTKGDVAKHSQATRKNRVGEAEGIRAIETPRSSVVRQRDNTPVGKRPRKTKRWREEEKEEW
ncbi:hypothetical protein ANTPLA_LOCUS10440 [Anthophora plagiata]